MVWFEDPEIYIWGNASMKDLKLDEAYLNITLADGVPSPLYLYEHSIECERCPFSSKLFLNSSQLTKIRTKYNTVFRLYTNGDTQLKPINDTRLLFCEIDPKNQIGEFGFYDLLIDKEKCELKVTLEPVNIIYSLLFWIFILSAIFSSYKLYKYFITKKRIQNDNDLDNGIVTKKKKRIKSLDTFRGMAISFMIFINYGAGGYTFLDHTPWDGIRFADFVFPWFLWIMGVTIPIVVSSRLRKNQCRHHLSISILRRSIILFILNLMLNTFPYKTDLDTIRVTGVLQRFAVCYLVVAGFSSYLTFKSDSNDSRLPSFIKDIVLLLPQWLIHVTILCIHGWLTFHVEVPGCPRGYVGPGGKQDNGKYMSCTGGVANYIDLKLLGVARMWDRGPAREVYDAISYDPEPMLGTLSSIFHVFLGTIAGSVLLHHKDSFSRIKRWLLYGVICLALSYYLVIFRQIPINKQLWSSSFVFFTSGVSFILLSGLYLIIDHYKVWDGSPFFYAGMNPTILYVGHSIGAMFPFIWSLSSEPNTHFLQLFQNIWTVLIWLLVAKWLHYKRFFLTI